jgi:fatty-acyl-CoA synthase
MNVRTLGEAIENTAKSSPKRGFRFIRDDKFENDFFTFVELEEKTRKLAGSLQGIGLRKGDRLALILPDSDQFVLTFLSALRAGVIPVPIYPPTGLGQLSGYVDNTRHIVRKCGAKCLITAPLIKPLLGTVQASCPDLVEVTTFASMAESNEPFTPVSISPEDTAFLQFTSGSTNRPKGVVLTHANLLANSHNIVVGGLKADPEVDSGFTWLPLFHDMGLIGFVLAPIVHGIEVSFMSPLLFLKRPSIWVRGMSHFKGTITFGPNFAYALSVKRVRARDIEGIDLSKWRVAGCGAEPIRAETLETFADFYASYGFKKEAFFPAYGLAESTLAVSFARSIPTDRVKASTLWSTDEAVPCDATDPDALRLVSCGPAFEAHRIEAFPMDDVRCESPLPERKVGEIRIKGPSVSPGYFEEPELTSKAFVDGWFFTGDLGYLADGNVHICGRSKEVVIIHGRNFYPQDIEWEASQVEGVRKGNAIAFGTRGDGGDREAVVLAFETAVADEDRLQAMTKEIRGRVQEVIGLMLDDVIPLAPGVLPKTSSGKLQRTKTRDLYEEGELVRRRSQRDADRIDQVKSIAKSQLGYLKLAVFGGRKREG